MTVSTFLVCLIQQAPFLQSSDFPQESFSQKSFCWTCICILYTFSEETDDTGEWSYDEWLAFYKAALQDAQKKASVCIAPSNGSALRTPLAKGIPIPEDTPPRVPLPTSKIALTAAKRMEAELRKTEKKVKSCGSQVSGQEKSKEAKPPKEQAPSKQKGKHPRKPNQGPVQDTFRQFMSTCKAQGHSHAKSLKRWKRSTERAQLIANMSPAERRRRRF